MTNRRRTKRRHRNIAAVVGGLVLVAGVYGGWHLLEEDADPAQYLMDRPWVTNPTDDPREKIHVLFLQEENSIGATVHGSSFRHLINILKFESDKSRLDVVSLQDGLKASARVKTYTCNAPRGLDLCLDLTVKGKRARLYSSTEWKNADADDAPRLARSLPGLLPEEQYAAPVNASTTAPAWFQTLTAPH